MPDYPRSPIAFQRRFGDGRARAEHLFSVRWPEGFRCPARGHPKAWAFQCAKCAKPGTRPGWTDQLLARRPTNVVLVAMANKTARVAWALLWKAGPDLRG